MRFLIDRWRRIGVRLYLALGIAVFLTLVSAAVGVYYFEQSGDLNYELESESVPALEASWAAAREAERLRGLGLGVVAGSESGFRGSQEEAVEEALGRLQIALDDVSGIPALTSDAQAVNDGAYDLADIIANLTLSWNELLAADVAAADYGLRLATTSSDVGRSEAALSVLRQALQANSESALQGLLDEFSRLHSVGIDPAVSSLGAGEGVFFVRGRQLAAESSIGGLASSFEESNVALDSAVAGLLAASQTHSSEALGLTVSSFDEGRTLLTAISVISVIVATLAAWVWVGNGMVRRLSRMSERMREMADGDLETPVPEVGRDEIGELANALEVFRQQALEVQRLNLVERLYEELRQANAELERAQARLVAQEKLAALGELVSGVAHEISNPLNFVNNFSEGSLELYSELKEMLETYRDRMTVEDTALLDDVSQELTDSLNRVLSNGGRALAIVERMRSFGVVGGVATMTDLNGVLRDAVLSECNRFTAEWQDFSVQPMFDLDSSLGEMLLVERDFGEAISNLVSNACFAMLQKRDMMDEEYGPDLKVSSRLVDGVVEVRVRDNGIGISAEIAEHIFNPFFSTREGASGAGLGLSLAADVARRFGGELSVDTVPGEHTEFTMKLQMTITPVAVVESGEAG